MAAQIRDLIVNEGFTELTFMNPKTGEKRVIKASLGSDPIVDVVARAIEVFGTREKALRWLRTPVRSLGDKTPSRAREHDQSRIGGSLWEYPMRYIENSPLFQADRVKTPILMIHNDADDAVPWYQGNNGEPHGLRRRPNQKDYTLRLQQYFDYFLKGAPKPDWMEHGIPYIESHPVPARGVGSETESQ